MRAQTTRGSLYQVAAELPADFPASAPILLLWYPKDQVNSAGKKLSAVGVSHEMHMLGPVRDYPRICHTQDWQENDTIIKVLEKGIIWVHALDRTPADRQTHQGVRQEQCSQIATIVIVRITTLACVRVLVTV